jgi:glycerol-3-phosphate O-acyltransferase
VSTQVAVPLWLLVILTGLAAWSFVLLLLTPGIRWLLRRRIERALTQLSANLAVELPSFKLTRRQVLIDRLVHDPKVQAAAAAHASASGVPLPVAWGLVERYAREIVPSFNAYVYFRIGYALSRAIARTLYRVRIGYADEAMLRNLNPESTLVFVMNHRSNMDYVLVAFLAAEHVILSYAVGEWARVWPLQQLVRSMGAFFVRRNSRDALYRAVLARYVHMATEAGVTQAVFPEGGLTVDGRLGLPKFGLLDYMLKGYDEREGEGRRELLFIPVGINYDRVLEDRTQLMKLDPGRPRISRWRALRTVVAFNARNVWLALQGRWYRYGYACVNFGAPISMRAWCRSRGLHFPDLDEERRRREVARVGVHLMEAVGEIIPVLPVSLVASVLLETPPSGWSELELKAAVFARLHTLQIHGARIYIPRKDQDYAFGVGLRMLVLRELVTEDGGIYRPAAGAGGLIAYYANAIEHLPGAGGVTAAAQYASA